MRIERKLTGKELTEQEEDEGVGERGPGEGLEDELAGGRRWIRKSVEVSKHDRRLREEFGLRSAV